MICYADRTFCEFWEECANGKGCRAALTEEVKQKAEKWWGETGAPIAVYTDKPTCFKQKEDGS